jgi:hypothetical protein
MDLSFDIISSYVQHKVAHVIILVRVIDIQAS